MARTLEQRCRLRFRRLERAARRRLLVYGLTAWLAVLGLILLVWLTTLGAAQPPRAVALGLVASGALLGAAAGLELGLLLWRRLRSRSVLAAHCDRAGGYADTLAAAEEALRRPDRWRKDTPVRRALVEMLLLRSIDLLDRLPLPRVLPLWRPAKVLLLLAGVLAAFAWLLAASPQTLDRGARALGRSWLHAADAAPGSLRLSPGPQDVRRGEELTVAALDLHGGDQPAVCEIRIGSGLWQRVPARRTAVAAADPVLGAPFERWEADLGAVDEDLVYRFRRGRRLSGQKALTVLHPPLLLGLAGRVIPPRYTGLPPQDLPSLPAYLEVPQGSRLLLRGRASQILADAALTTADGESLGLRVQADSLFGELTVAEPRRLRPSLRDRRGLTAAGDLVYEIAVLPDRVPIVGLERTGGGDTFIPAATLALRAEAEDDHGLATVDLQVRRGTRPPGDDRAAPGDLESLLDADAAGDQDGWRSIPLLEPSGAPRTGRVAAGTRWGELTLAIAPLRSPPAGVRLALDLSAGALALVPGDVLELRLVARDGRRPGPPGEGRSPVLRLRVPSNLDLLRAGEQAQVSRREDLADMRQRNRSLAAELERLRRELLRDPLPEWDRLQSMQATVRRQQELQGELARLAEALRRDLEATAAQQLASPQLLERMERLADLLAEHEGDDLARLLARLTEAAGEMSPRELAEAIADLQRDQVAMMRRLEAAQQVLRDLSRQQQLEGLTETVADLIRKQHELAEEQRRGAPDHPAEDRADGPDRPDGDRPPRDGADAADRDVAEEAARRQDALAREMAALEERLQEALAELEQSAAQDGPQDGQDAAAEAMREALAEALQQLRDQQTAETMRQAGEEMAQMSQEALARMQQALGELAGLYHVLLRSQAAMQMAMQMEQGQQLRDLAADLLALSDRQEQLGLDLPTSLRDLRSDDLARRQHEVLQGVIGLHAGLLDAAGAAPREVLRMLQELDELIEGVGRTLAELQEGRAQATRQGAREALAGMNRLVIDLLTQAQVTGQGGGSCDSQPQLAQQLQQMSEQQAQLNALSERLSWQEGRLDQETRAGMQRLAQGQDQLAERARQLAGQTAAEDRPDGRNSEGGRILGDLDRLARDMQQVGDELADGLIGEQTLRRQERILSRLLDMHNASRERDWARRREGRTAPETFAEQAGDPRPEDPANRFAEARRWRAVERAPAAYRDLVRDYFRAIGRLHEQGGRDAEGLRPRRGELP